jgi:hypothetical protein
VTTPGSLWSRKSVALLLLCLSGMTSCSSEVVVVARQISSDVTPTEQLPPSSSDAGLSQVPLVDEAAVRDASPREDADTSAEPVTDDDEPGRDFDED